MEKPDKEHKVQGEFLLSYRDKIESQNNEINTLREEKAQLNAKIESTLVRLEAVNTTVQERAKQLQTLESEKNDLQQLLDNTRSEVDEKTKELESKDKEIADLESDGEKLSGALAEKDAQLADASGNSDLVEEKDKIIAEKDNTIAEKDNEIAGLNEALEGLKAQTADAGEAGNKVGELEAQVAELNKSLQDADQKISDLEGELGQFKKAPEPAEAPLMSDAGPSAGSRKGIATTVPWSVAEREDKCPRCGGGRIKDEQDRTKILYMAAGTPIYAKKHVCMNCGHEWG